MCCVPAVSKSCISSMRRIASCILIRRLHESWKGVLVMHDRRRTRFFDYLLDADGVLGLNRGTTASICLPRLVVDVP